MCASLPAHALLTRADRDDAEYLELATRYTAAITLGARGGEAVVIHPLWILTTAEHARSLQQPDARVAFGSRTYRVQGVHVHPRARPGQP